MYSVPRRILNRIAATQTLRHQWARNLFAMDEEGKVAALEGQADVLEARGVEQRVVMNYQVIAPLLAENVAISRFIVAMDDLELRMMLPEIVTVEEALLIADMERPMSSDETVMLWLLLVGLPQG